MAKNTQVTSPSAPVAPPSAPVETFNADESKGYIGVKVDTASDDAYTLTGVAKTATAK